MPALTHVTCLFAMLAAVSGAAVAAEPAADAALETIGDRCTREHGYDWRNPGELGEHELGAGETAWRECVYAAIRRDIMPGSSVPGEYERIIAQDQAFTRAIAGGTMTRSERRRQNAAEQRAIAAIESQAATPPRNAEDDMVDRMRRELQNVLRGIPGTPRPHY